MTRYQRLFWETKKYLNFSKIFPEVVNIFYSDSKDIQAKVHHTEKLEFYAKNFLVDTINDKASLIFGGLLQNIST